jgi:diguanylate cyclase (GGDEF)-like protein
MSQGIMMVDADRRVAVWNAKAIELLELPPELTTPGIPYRDVVAYQNGLGEFKSSGASLDAALLEPSDDGPLVYERTRPNGRVLEVQSVRLETGGMVRTYTDITDRRASEAQIRYFAHHDDLTKLVNRVVFLARLEHAIELADRTGRSIAVLYLDLDRFKVINDSEGHAIGDKLLRQVAARLRDASRDIDTVARMGGDEFAIIQPLIDQPDASAKFAARIMHVVAQPYEIDGLQCRAGISIGIAHYPEDATSVAELLRHADTALYRAKADGRGLYRVFEPQMDARQQELFTLEQELRQALDSRQFEVEYQPIVETTSGRIASCEALLRWRHPVRGTVPPVDFIGIAERSGLIMPIGLWVLETACRDAAAWPNGVRVSVNLSPVQFNQDSLVDEMTNIFERTGLSPDRLSLEVTEGLLLEATDAVLSIMERLRGLGIRFSLDDFGTGYAGLGYLRRFPFDAIKIDKFFVNDMVEQPEMRAIVEALVGIGAALKLEFVAEGVETQAQLTHLRCLGCTYVQGFLTGRPQLAVEIRSTIIAGS